MAVGQSPSDQISYLIRLGLPPTKKEIVAIHRIDKMLSRLVPYARHRGVDVRIDTGCGAAKISVGSPKMWISVTAMSGGQLDFESALETALISKNGTNTNTFVTHIQTWDDMISMFDYILKTLKTTMSPDFCTHIQHTVGNNQVTPTLVGCVIGKKYTGKSTMAVTITEDGSYTTCKSYTDWTTESHSDLGVLCEYLAKEWPPKRSRAKATRDRKKLRDQFNRTRNLASNTDVGDKD
jgi:hypothetical protein